MQITVDLVKLDGTSQPTNWNIGTQNYIQIDIKLTVTSPHHTQPLTGEVLKNNQVICRFSRTNTGLLTENWFGGKRQPIYVKTDDKLIQRVLTPQTTSVTKNILRGGDDIIDDKRYQPIIEKSKFFLQGDVVPHDDVLEEVIDRMSDYQDISYSSRQSINIRNIERYIKSEVDLPPVTINIFDDQNELQDQLDELKPVTQKDIFNTWPRFVFNAGGSGQQYWENPQQQTDGQAQWQWQENNQRVYMPLNQQVWSGFMSDKKYDRYDLECTVGSTDGDDDWKQIIIQHKFENDINKLLMVVVSSNQGGQTWPNNQYGQMIIAYNGGNLDLHNNNYHTQTNSLLIPFTTDPRPGGGWSGKERRIGIVRRGDTITIRLSNWNQTVFNETLTKTINLNDYPDLATFKGPQAYGFTNFSQGQSYYKDLFFDGGERMDTITYQPTGEVYTYEPSTGWTVEQGLNLVDIYGQPRVLISEKDGRRFLLNTNGSITAI